MNATQFLTQQHDEVRQFFADCEALEEGEFKRRSDIFSKIFKTLKCHTQIEEEILYPMAKNVDNELVLEAIEEHHMIKILLDEIDQTPPSNERYVAKLAVLQEMVESHIDEEEGVLFPEVTESCGTEKLDTVGLKLEERFKELWQGVSATR